MGADLAMTAPPMTDVLTVRASRPASGSVLIDARACDLPPWNDCDYGLMKTNPSRFGASTAETAR